MTNQEKAERIANAILAPLPEGIKVEAHAHSYLRPISGSDMLGAEIPENFSEGFWVCASGRAVLGLAETKEKAEEIILEWLERPSGVGWEDHAAKHLGVSTYTVVMIGEVFKYADSYEKMAEILRTNPEQFFQNQDLES